VILVEAILKEDGGSMSYVCGDKKGFFLLITLLDKAPDVRLCCVMDLRGMLGAKSLGVNADGSKRWPSGKVVFTA
jgi:hypothetical protein